MNPLNTYIEKQKTVCSRWEIIFPTESNSTNNQTPM